MKTLNFEYGFEHYVRSSCNNINIGSITKDTWIITSEKEQTLISKLTTRFNNLFDYIGGLAHYGIKTGLSEAFIIDDATRKRLIAQDENSRSLIHPFLLGRNTKAYAVPNVNQYLILIPKGFTIRKNLEPENPYYIQEPMHRYGDMPEKQAWNWFSSNYLAIAEHLLPYKPKAEKRTDQGDFWWELRACDYYAEFSKPKIMYQKFQVKPCFIFDNNGLYCNDSMWIIPTNDKVLLAILNSKMGWWLISKYCTAIQNGYQLIWKYFGQIPIAKPKEDQLDLLERVDTILRLKQETPDVDTFNLEFEIDQLVYQLYGLSEEEIKIVEGT